MISPLQHAALSIMDSSSLSNKDVRRQASASRRSARGVGGVNGGTDLLSSLSQALANIDRYNNSERSGAGGEGVDDDGNGTRRSFGSETITFAASSIGSIHNDNAQNSSGKSPYHPKKPSPPPPSQFSSYIKFNRLTIHSLLAFAVCYLLVLICCYPMVYYSNVDVLPTDDDYANGGRHHIKRGSSFEHVRGRKQLDKARHAFGTMKERAVRWEEVVKVEAKRRAKALRDAERKVMGSIVGGAMGRRDGEDAVKAGMLMEQAVKDFEDERSAMEAEEERRNAAARGGRGGGHDHWKDALETWDREIVRPDANDVAIPADGGDARKSNKGADRGMKTPGFMVLGMHRSGTSMLSGLLVKGFGYETGGPLIGASVSWVKSSFLVASSFFMFEQHLNIPPPPLKRIPIVR